MLKPLTGKKTLLIALATFGVVFAVNGYMVAKAISTYTGEDADDAYIVGANYNQTLARRAEQAALGWHAAIGAEREGASGVRLVVSVKARDGRPVDRLNISGVLRHPSDAHRDRTITLTETQAGVYAATLEHVAPGSWDVDVHSGAHNRPFDATRTVWLR
jgi:nitrogen fixation protein FixH